MFHKVLIANRGEIAVRVITACKELGIKTVAVYSQADSSSLHVRLADEAVCIGPPPVNKSYLNIPSIISAAEITDAEAIHPGYGFLAENPHFAEICEGCAIKFIGPPPEVLRSMGDKAHARNVAKSAGVSLLPGSNKITELEEAQELTDKIGYPLIIKAAAGGGGRGMRVVHTEASFRNAFLVAQAEANASFGNQQLYIEKYLNSPKHIEFQLLADDYGNIIHLGERDCSIQRRYQKLIEEAPAIVISSKLRKKMGDAAITIAKKANYVNAGTIEFLVDKKKNFYFMEMNTRIQVEHPVTEMVTNIDLIKEQLRIAAGEKLTYKQSDIKLSGHSIECRINAEDPETFAPTPGRITEFIPPCGPGIRLDTAYSCHSQISPYYDSLIGKLITWGHDRNEAITKLRLALKHFNIQGIKTTIPFQIKVLKNAKFLAGDFSTHFIETFFAN